MSQAVKASFAQVSPLAFTSILVHAEPGAASTARTQVAARLARESGARLIGLAATTIEPMIAFDPYGGQMAGDLVALAQEQVQADLQNAREAFHRDADGADVEWRVVEDYASKAVARVARAADLIVLSAQPAQGAPGKADPGEVALSAGRPVLVTPDGADHLHARNVIIAWKDRREARRAVADALPLLQRAEAVVVASVCEGAAAEAAAYQTEDVAVALQRHGVNARSVVTHAPDESAAMQLARLAELNGADLIVAGAYGHSRLAEWAFGGLTRDLLREPPCFLLLSH